MISFMMGANSSRRLYISAIPPRDESVVVELVCGVMDGWVLLTHADVYWSF